MEVVYFRDSPKRFVPLSIYVRIERTAFQLVHDISPVCTFLRC